MMELTIKITKKNVQQIAKLLPLLVGEDESEQEIVDVPTKEDTHNMQKYLSVSRDIKGLKPGNVVLSERTKTVGSWGQFNSFFPIKAVLRVVTNLMIENKSNSVDLNDVVKLCRTEFKKEGLTKYRGFPISDKPSSTGRLVWHFITTAYEMGLINIEDGHGTTIPHNDWVGIHISPSEEGFDFAVLPNRIFDLKEDIQIFTLEEKSWLINHLKKIDRAGYKEFSFLSQVYDVLRRGEDLKSFLEDNKLFCDYVESWSRKTSPKELKKQISNLSLVFSSSKIALLREFGVVSNKRNDYTVIADLV